MTRGSTKIPKARHNVWSAFQANLIMSWVSRHSASCVIMANFPMRLSSPHASTVLSESRPTARKVALRAPHALPVASEKADAAARMGPDAPHAELACSGWAPETGVRAISARRGTFKISRVQPSA